jgi:ParB-like chromosome segregation protein Spo0J
MSATKQPTQDVVMLDLAQLAFDPDNPRLPPRIDSTSDSKVLAWMLTEEGLLELMGSIGAQGYFSGEPLLVAPRNPRRPNGSYIVVEGNRRLAAAKLLNDPNLASEKRGSVRTIADDARHRPGALPVIIYPSRDDVLEYLGYRHVTGVKEWDSLAKARYVRQLLQRASARGESLTHADLARLIGSRADYVRRLLDGLEVYDYIAERNFFALPSVDEDSVNFSVLTTALSYTKIAHFVRTGEDDSGDADSDGDSPTAIDDSALREIVDWTFRKRDNGTSVVGESRNLGQLAEVVGNRDARAALRKGSPLSDAALLTDEPLIAFRRAVQQAKAKVEIARSLTHKVSNPQQADLDDITALSAMLRDLSAVLRSKIAGEDPDL